MKKGYYVFSILFFILSCNIDFPEGQQISSTIQAAKEKKVLVTEYKATNIKVFDSSLHFPIDSSIWEEKYWHLVLDKSGNITYKIEDSDTHTLVFSPMEKDSFNAEKWSMEWIVGSDTLYNGLDCNMINMELGSNSITATSIFTIYRMEDEYHFKNDQTKLFQFNLERK